MILQSCKLVLNQPVFFFSCMLGIQPIQYRNKESFQLFLGLPSDFLRLTGKWFREIRKILFGAMRDTCWFHSNLLLSTHSPIAWIFSCLLNSSFLILPLHDLRKIFFKIFISCVSKIGQFDEGEKLNVGALY